MDRHHTSLLLILLTFQLGIVSLNAHSFVPLIRDRSIRDDDMNKNIESIFRKDFKTTATPKLETSATGLVQRAHISTRTKIPIDKNDQNVPIFVERNAEGALVPVFPTTKIATPQPEERSYELAGEQKFVLKDKHFLKGGDSNEFEEGSYPPDYPRKEIMRILENNIDTYGDLFEHAIKREQLTTRVNSEDDKYLCNSIAHTEYPTRVHNYTIVNYNKFFQAISYETCTTLNGTCSNSHTGEGYMLRCEQTYRKHKLFAVPPNFATATKFQLVEVEYPSCCKCAHVAIPKKDNH